jgi:hypothetical protein
MTTAGNSVSTMLNADDTGNKIISAFFTIGRIILKLFLAFVVFICC